MRIHCPHCGKLVELVTMEEIAERLNLKLATVSRMRQVIPGSGSLPEPDYMIGRTPTWHRSTIEAWARETGRS